MSYMFPHLVSFASFLLETIEPIFCLPSEFWGSVSIKELKSSNLCWPIALLPILTMLASNSPSFPSNNL